MPLDTIDQPVNPGDLILAYTSKRKWMFLVTSIPSEQDNPDTSTILVKRASYRIVDKPGFWTLSGPDVYYVEKEADEQSSDEASDDDDSTDEGDARIHEVKPLRAFLDELAGSLDVAVVVNPHGRRVLEHFFSGTCPYCGNITFFCPGCQGDYPEFFGSCAVWLSCPVCLGYDLAGDEKQGLRWLEDEEYQIRDYRRQAKESELSKSDKKRLREIKYEILEFLEEKYEAINERKKEMGLPLDDVDEQVKDYTDRMFSF
ncbi:hypothetical protein HFD88_003113 [Aspergillus terreus]|nr:hypothetical protein HFD88_003113 [Aspergillus terreus]